MLRVISSLFVAAALLASPAMSVDLTVRCYLDGETDHSGTRVDVWNCNSPYPCATKYTDINGLADFFVFPGEYEIHVSHQGFVSELRTCFSISSATQVDFTIEATSCPGDWQEYPYYPPGPAPFEFPDDEGRHPPLFDNPIEWWYASLHLTGQSGREYGAMVWFFKTGQRFMSVTDCTVDSTYTNTRLVVAPVISATEWNLTYLDGAFEVDTWKNKQICGGNRAPFEYRLDVDAYDEQEEDPLALDVFLASTKEPLMVSRDGFVELSNSSLNWYGHSRVEVSGQIWVGGRTETVTGTAWMDHEWGNMTKLDPITWERFWIQLDNGTDILAADHFLGCIPQFDIMGGLNFYDSGCDLDTIPLRAIVPLETWEDPQGGLKYATQWRILGFGSHLVDLTVTACHPDQMLRFGDLMGLDTLLVPWAALWDGECEVEGWVDLQQVSGKARVQSTHTRFLEWEDPDLDGYPDDVDTSHVECDNITDDNCDVGFDPWQKDCNGDGIGDACQYIVGDINRPLDSLCGGDGNISIADVTFMVAYQFNSGRAPHPLCLGDLNCDGSVDIADLRYLVDYLFGGGPAPCIWACVISPD